MAPRRPSAATSFELGDSSWLPLSLLRFLSMRAIQFADDAEWHVGPQAVPIEQFVLPELTVAGATATSQAIRLLMNELTVERMPHRGLPPVCILVSEGYCTDPAAEYDAAIAELLKQPWGLKAVRWRSGFPMALEQEARLV